MLIDYYSTIIVYIDLFGYLIESFSCEFLIDKYPIFQKFYSYL